MTAQLVRVALGALLLSVSAQAQAATRLFTIEGLPGFGAAYSFSFTLDTATLPNPVSSDSTRFNGTPITYTRPGGTTKFVENGMFDGPTFFAAINQGGIALQRLDLEEQPQFRLFGAQVFSGPLSAPVFDLRSYDLASTPRNGGDGVQTPTYRLTISDPSLVAAVPEPATWGMMILGFGAVGIALRRRRSGAAFAKA